MDKLDVILWVMSAGFGLQFSLLLIVWKSLNKRMDRLDSRMDRIENLMDRLDDKLVDVDRRLCRIEGTLSARDCCMLKEERNIRKAE